MSCSRPASAARLPRNRTSVARPLSAGLTTLGKMVIGRLTRYLRACRHARDMAEMTDRMRADIGLPPQPPSIRDRQTCPHAPALRRADWPRPHG